MCPASIRQMVAGMSGRCSGTCGASLTQASGMLVPASMYENS